MRGFSHITVPEFMVFLLQVLLLHSFFDVSSTIVKMRQMSDRVITTRYGKVRGMLVEFPNRHLRPVEAYLGLRYADLHGSTMRFMPPRSPEEQWSGIRIVSEYPAVCPQPTKHIRDHCKYLYEGRIAQVRNITPFLAHQNEDCHTLNLYVPIQGWNETTPMAVMVFVHGESYETGTGNAYDGSVLSSYGDVIVVTLNYRLGVLGFLSMEDQSALGNYALLDVIQALMWLRENIASFYGDPKRITLFGHGTGAAIVNLLLLSPFGKEDKGSFFQRAIIQSGSALSTWAMSYDPKWCAEKLASSVNCSRFAGNTHALVNCLRERDYSELVLLAPDAPKYYSCFAPSIDNWTVIPFDVKRLISEGKSTFATVPVMFGITKNEAYAYLRQEDIKKGIPDSRKIQIIRSYVQNVFRYHRQKIYEILYHHYRDYTHSSDQIKNRDNILELLSDGQYVAPLFEMANYHAETADTYVYSFAYSTQSESYDSENLQGIHGDELPYVFGSPLVNGLSPFPFSYTDTERMLSEAVMTYWTNFAKSGNPNEPRNQTSIHGEQVTNRFINLKWNKYVKETQEYMPIGRRPIIRNHYRAQNLALWLELIPKFDRDDGSDRSSHLLDDSDNLSTFDDPHRLIPNIDNIFPSPPPMPPVWPTPSSTLNDGSATTLNHLPPDVTAGESFPVSRSNPDNPFQSSHHNGQPNTDKTDGPPVEPDEPTGTSKGTTGVPLSIVVAIGGSLLLINVIIFAGLCYQRERIKKLRMINKPAPAGDLEFDHSRFRRVESNQSSPCAVNGDGAGHECVSLVSGASAHQHASPVKPTHGNTHNASPQISLHSRRAHSQTRATPPIESVTCNYSAVPTNVTSPIHRTHIGVSKSGVHLGQGGDTNQGRVHVPADVNHKAALDINFTSGDDSEAAGCRGIGTGGVSTFTGGLGVASGRVGDGTARTPSSVSGGRSPATASAVSVSSGAVPGAASSSNSSGNDPLYKTINKSGQNNAVTIV